MRLDLKRHKLLKILSEKRVRFESDELPKDEALGVSFDELTNKIKCSMLKLNLIAAELYNNNEVSYHNAFEIKGICCEKNGLASFANNKYKARYWRDLWTNLLTINQIIIPIMALAIALITVLDSRQSKEHTEEILLLRKEIHKLQELQDSQTIEISNMTNILKNDQFHIDLNN